MGGSYTTYSGKGTAQPASGKAWGDYTTYKAPVAQSGQPQNYNVSNDGGYTPPSQADRQAMYNQATNGIGNLFYQNVTLPQIRAAEAAAKAAEEAAAKKAAEETAQYFGSAAQLYGDGY